MLIRFHCGLHHLFFALVVLALLTSQANAQESAAPSPTTSDDLRGFPTSYAPASSSPPVTPRLAFAPLPTLTACNTANVTWGLLNDTGLVDFDITLWMISSSLNETGSDGQEIQPINATLVTQKAMHPSSYVMEVTFPDGQYYIEGRVNDLYHTSNRTNGFTVIAHGNSSCLGPLTDPSSQDSDLAKSSGLSHGAIAGIVIGVILGIVILLSATWIVRNRRRRMRQVHGAHISGRYTSGVGWNPGGQTMSSLALTHTTDHGSSISQPIIRQERLSGPTTRGFSDVSHPHYGSPRSPVYTEARLTRSEKPIGFAGYLRKG